jgi:hypothetical protein
MGKEIKVQCGVAFGDNCNAEKGMWRVKQIFLPDDTPFDKIEENAIEICWEQYCQADRIKICDIWVMSYLGIDCL